MKIKISISTKIIGICVIVILLVFGLLMWGTFEHEPKKKALIQYNTGYEYILAKTYTIDVPIKETANYGSGSLVDLENGKLTIKSGFAWNGATGAIDTRARIRASMVHDALWGLMVNKKISRDYKDVIDGVYMKLAKEDGETSTILEMTKFVFKKFGGHFFFEDEIKHAA